MEFREEWFQKQAIGAAKDRFSEVDEGFNTRIKACPGQLVERS